MPHNGDGERCWKLSLTGKKKILAAPGQWCKEDNVRRLEADMHQQVYGKMRGVIRGVEAFLLYLRGKAVLHLTDCAQVCVVTELG